MKTTLRTLAALCLGAVPVLAGGTLTPTGSPDKPILILDHQVEVVIQNGFARTEVTQSFYNPNTLPLEAIYRVPVPENASLSEMTIFLGEETLEGEVVDRDQGRKIYEEERDSGKDAGLAEQQETKVYDFHIANVPAGGEVRFRYIYYQPLEIDTGVGRYLYPLEEGGTDDAALAFWTQETMVQRDFSFHARIESVWPLTDIRVPGLEALTEVRQLSEDTWDVSWQTPGGVALERDLVLYYHLADDLPGRIEMIPFRDDLNGPGTFMLIVTPGVDLAPLTGGSDYVFVLDVSGSMGGKLGTLCDGVVRAIGELKHEDRFRVITFSEVARDLTGGFVPAGPAQVEAAIRTVRGLAIEGGTNLYRGLKLALEDLDADRATSVILVTDAVANQGVVNPKKFAKLMRSHDVRLFGFLLGNSANWPLMRTITEATGGFYASISNADDILGQIMLAKSKVTSEAMHDADLSISGVHTFDTGLGHQGKIYRGEQLVVFGRYEGPGAARIELTARITGDDKVYATEVVFPELDMENPEIERLWALDRIDAWQLAIDRGLMDEKEGDTAIADLAVAYQLVTEQTSMLVLSDQAFAERGIARLNRERVANERAAQAVRMTRTPRNHRVDTHQPAFNKPAPRLTGFGGGAFGPLSAGLALLLAAAGARLGRRRAQGAGQGAGQTSEADDPHRGDRVA